MLTSTIMTRAANESVEPVHDRMPVILGIEEREAWLGGSEELDLGAGATVRYQAVGAFGIKDEGEQLTKPL